jgi:hypothetical protein
LKAWKQAEKEAARLLGGLRRWRVSYSESVGDIIHRDLSVEVKYGKQIPKSLIVKKPTFVGDYFILPSRGRSFLPVISRGLKKNKFIQRSLQQAKSYAPGKVPIVALKPYRYRGIIFVCKIWDRLVLEEALGKGREGRKEGKPLPPYDIKNF